MGASGRAGSCLLSSVVAVALAVLLHVSLVADPVSAGIPCTVAPKYSVPRGRSSPQMTELPGAKTAKGAKAVLVKGTPTTGGPTTPWRPPVVNLNNHGGPVMNKPIHIHFIWYGTWDPAVKAVIRTAVQSLTPAKPIASYPNFANWWKIVAQYTQKAGGLHVSNSVTIGSEVDDQYSETDNLGQVAEKIIRNNLKPQGGLPVDPVSGIYMIMTSADVKFQQGGFCGYHDKMCTDGNQAPNSTFCSNINNILLYTFMPFPGDDVTENSLLNGCCVYDPYGPLPLPAPNDAVSPVGGALDSYISTMMHEIMETATDPYINAWRQNDNENSEAGDLCSYSYGGGDYYYCGLASIYGTYHGGTDPSVCQSYPNYHVLRWTATGEIFNIFGLNGARFLVQMIWSLANKGCQLQYAPSCSGTQTLTAKTGVVERGAHLSTIPLQTYAPGESCQYAIAVPKAKTLNLTFYSVATGYDQLDHIDVFQGKVLKKKITGSATAKVVVQLVGNSTTVKWTSYGGKSPFPDATGFKMVYTSA